MDGRAQAVVGRDDELIDLEVGPRPSRLESDYELGASTRPSFGSQLQPLSRGRREDLSLGSDGESPTTDGVVQPGANVGPVIVHSTDWGRPDRPSCEEPAIGKYLPHLIG